MGVGGLPLPVAPARAPILGRPSVRGTVYA
jgi:hypothetical protein